MKTFKPNSTNKNKGYKTHGSFKMDSRTKPGSGASPNKDVKEKRMNYVTKRLKKISKGMFHIKEGNPMKAQENG